ncbi:MAG: allophanate hydrolase [Caulobacterales bacterium]
MTDMAVDHFLAARIAADVVAGKTSALAIAENTLKRIAAYDLVQPQVWISRCADDDVRMAAKAIDKRIKAGENLPLAGVPFAVKDNLDVAGLQTTAACPAFAYTPKHSATVVDLLIAAGAVLIGKTNLDQFATGLVGVRSPYGAPHCVFNSDYVSGGSSSGSAVAVAAGLVAFALGTDTAGSGRVPAAFNNLIGFKPTKGRWSTRGLVPACRSLDCVTVFTHDVKDAALVDHVLAHFDEADVFSRPKQALAPSKKTKLGIPKGALNWCGDAQSEALFAKAVARANAAGAELVEIDIAPLVDCAKLLYQGPYVAERTAALRDFMANYASAMHPVVRGIVQGGAAYSAADAYAASYELKAYERAAAAIWRKVDALILPTAPTIYSIAEVEAEPVALNANLGLYTNFVNLLDMSAIAAPAGFRENGTGFGVTFIGPAWADEYLRDLAQSYLEADPAFDAPPLATEAQMQQIKLAVVGAHLNGMPLHWQLTSRNARLVKSCKTAPAYKLYAMANSTPPKPALVYVGDGGAAIELEVYELDEAAFGSFTAEVPPPLAIGTVTLDSGENVKGFVAEPRAFEGAEDITHLGGWRAYIASKQS